jgi:hypothetical protein
MGPGLRRGDEWESGEGYFHKLSDKRGAGLGNESEFGHCGP